MTGGVNCPLVEDATSTAPAFSAESPVRFIKGIVNVPVVTVLAMDDPEYNPLIADASTAAFAGPPRRCPNSAKATLIKKFPAPDFSNIDPNRTNRNISDADTPSATPNTPSFCIQ